MSGVMAESIPGDDHSSLTIATLNIINAGRSRLNAALRCMREMNVDLGILTETKLYHTKYSKACEGYVVKATVSERMKGGVALFYRRDSKDWSLESTKHFDPNVIRATLVVVSGQKHWTIIGACVPPSECDGKTLDWITQTWVSRPNHCWPTILLGDLNVDLDRLGDDTGDGMDRRVQTAALVDSFGLSNLRNHFRQHQRHLGRFWT
jgi:Exonuclease III